MPARDCSFGQASALAITFVSPLALAHSRVCRVEEGTSKPTFRQSARATGALGDFDLSACLGGLVGVVPFATPPVLDLSAVNSRRKRSISPRSLSRWSLAD